MNPKKIFILVITILVCYNTYSQEKLKKNVCCCSTIIEQLSEGWKNDSLANNGFRQLNAKLFFTCKLDSMRLKVLLRKFGNPSHKQERSDGTEYRYYSYDIRTKPKNFDGPAAAWGVTFFVRFGSDYISSIDECDIDLF